MKHTQQHVKKHFSGLLAPIGIVTAQFGQGLQPISQGAFAPADLQQVTVLTTLNNAISFLVTLITSLGGLFFLYQVMSAAINWINAAGEQKKIQEARDRITQGVLGLLLLVVSYAVIGLVSTVFGIEILNPGQFLERTFLQVDQANPPSSAGTNPDIWSPPANSDDPF